MSSRQCVVGIGEVLMDVFENGQATVGGAPFNVTFHLHQLLTVLSMGEAVFLSAVGRDAWGRHICSVAAAAGMSVKYLSETDRPTGTALVFEREGGAGFEIKPNVSWDSIQLSEDARRLAQSCDATVFGSLAQRSEVSRNSIRQFVSSVKGHRLYDVNLRRNTTDGGAGYSAEIIASSLKLATVVKMNDAELEEVASLLGFTAESIDPDERIRQFMQRLRAEYSLTTVAITRGSKGALLASEGKQLRLPDSCAGPGAGPSGWRGRLLRCRAVVRHHAGMGARALPGNGQHPVELGGAACLRHSAAPGQCSGRSARPVGAGRQDNRSAPFTFFAAMTTIQFLVVLFFYPETKGQTLEQLQRRLVKS